jgi:diacylglycerol kinase family enzyme
LPYAATVFWDAALFENRAALAFVGAGFDANVARRVAAARRHSVGVQVSDYVREGLWSLCQGPWPELRAEVDGRIIPGRFNQILAASVENYARYFHTRQNGRFHAYLFRVPGPGGVLRNAARLIGGRLRLERAADLHLPIHRRLRIWAAKGTGHYQFDGEAGYRLPLDLIIRGRALKLLASVRHHGG